MTILSEKIKMVRRELGFTQEEFARKLKISRSNLRDLETGKNKGGNLVLLNKLSDVTKKPISFFIKDYDTNLNSYEILDDMANKLISLGKIDKQGKVDLEFKDSIWEILELEFRLKQERNL